MHSAILCSIDAYRLRRYSGVSFNQTLLQIFFTSSIVIGFFTEIFLFMIPQTFSMGFRSGFWPGHPSKSWIPCSAFHCFVSCNRCAGANLPFHFLAFVFEASLQLNGFTDWTLLGPNLFIFSRALIWSKDFDN